MWPKAKAATQPSRVREKLRSLSQQVGQLDESQADVRHERSIAYALTVLGAMYQRGQQLGRQLPALGFELLLLGPGDISHAQKGPAQHTRTGCRKRASSVD